MHLREISVNTPRAHGFILDNYARCALSRLRDHDSRHSGTARPMRPRPPALPGANYLHTRETQDVQQPWHSDRPRVSTRGRLGYV